MAVGLFKKRPPKPRHAVGDVVRIDESGRRPLPYMSIGEVHWPRGGGGWVYSGFMFEIVGTVIDGKPAGIPHPTGYSVDVPETMLVKVRGMHL